MPELADVLKGVYILCLCEGKAEIAIMNMLLEKNLLVFSRKDLIKEKVHQRKNVDEIQKKFLNVSYEKPLVILMIIDSKNEKFILDKAYKDRFDIKKCLTKPEVEILVILDAGKYKEFEKVKSTIKPSIFCKTQLKHKYIKNENFINEYFDIDRLLNALRVYKQNSKKDHYTICDLLK